MMCVCVRYAICDNVTYPSVCEIRTRTIMRTSPALPTIVCTVRTFFRHTNCLQQFCWWVQQRFQRKGGRVCCPLVCVHHPAGWLPELGNKPSVLLHGRARFSLSGTCVSVQQFEPSPHVFTLQLLYRLNSTAYLLFLFSLVLPTSLQDERFRRKRRTRK